MIELFIIRILGFTNLYSRGNVVGEIDIYLYLEADTQGGSIVNLNDSVCTGFPCECLEV